MAAWWQSAVIYQIYPRSFQDSDGDGIGDLKGILQRLDHLEALGVDAIWLSPVFPSPMADFGYDVSDYCDVDPLFGSLADLDKLIAEAHARKLRVILDFVPNHSSDQHPWFIESRSSRLSAKRDWYIWQDPAADGGPPNNWGSTFGGSAWDYDAATGQYFYHAFLKEQPDLNWRHPQVQAAMHDVLRFWMRRGVDGFRIDVLWHLMKDPQFRDNPVNPDWQPGMPDITRTLRTQSCDHPDILGIVEGLRNVADEFEDRVLIGELYRPLERLVDYYGPQGKGVHLPFNFHLMDVEWRARDLAELVQTYEGLLPEGAWPNWVLGNHDQPRIASRLGPEQARIAMMLLLTLRGTPTLYQGDELGLPDAIVAADQVRDPWALREPDANVGRDPQRSPMPWDGGTHSGFSSAKPWLPLVDHWRTLNVAVQEGDAGSMLALTRQLLKVRRSSQALSLGTYRLICAEGTLLVYERRWEEERKLIALNLGSEPVELRGIVPNRTRPCAGTHMPIETVAGDGLAANEGIVVDL